MIVRDDGPEILTPFTKDLVAHVAPAVQPAPLESRAVAEQVSTNQFKNGMHVEIDGQVWRIVEFQHVKPGKGGAFVRTKLKAVDTGAVVDKTFRAGEKMPRIRTETKSVQYLYDDGDDVVFMDEENFEQIHLPRGEVADELDVPPAVELGAAPARGRPAGRHPAAGVGRARGRRRPSPASAATPSRT